MTTIDRDVVLYVDVGADDYVGILLLLAFQVRILAIVCSSGNTSIDNVCVNLVRLLEFVGRRDIPVYRGAVDPLISSPSGTDYYYGLDGFGDLHNTTSPDLSIIRPEPAAQAIAELVLANPDQISLLCVAPLTNVALSIRLYEDFADSIRDIWIMGGNYEAIASITGTSEFNFYFDVDAAYITLSTIKKPINILTWEAGLLVNVTLKWRFDEFGAKKYPAIELLNRAEKNMYEGETIWMPCDAFLIAAFIDPANVITKSSCQNATVELHGSETRGQMVFHEQTQCRNLTIIEEIDPEQFKQLLLAVDL